MASSRPESERDKKGQNYGIDCFGYVGCGDCVAVVFHLHLQRVGEPETQCLQVLVEHRCVTQTTS